MFVRQSVWPVEKGGGKKGEAEQRQCTVQDEQPVMVKLLQWVMVMKSSLSGQLALSLFMMSSESWSIWKAKWLALSMVSGHDKNLYFDGSKTCPPAIHALIAFWVAEVSSVLPSPLAP